MYVVLKVTVSIPLQQKMASTKKVFDLVIIGAGMMGSAAAYHSSQIPGTSVCLVGPSEPKVRIDFLSMSY